MPVLRYRCPRCKAMLNPGTKVVVRFAHGGSVGLMLLAPRLGDYEVILPVDIRLADGDQGEFSCPVCGASFTNPDNPDFNEILRERRDGGFDRVDFHRTYGRHATFVVTSDQEVQAYGKDAAGYQPMNFFGAGPATTE